MIRSIHRGSKRMSTTNSFFIKKNLPWIQGFLGQTKRGNQYEILRDETTDAFLNANFNKIIDQIV